jgi:hypothetical protein
MEFGAGSGELGVAVPPYGTGRRGDGETGNHLFGQWLPINEMERTLVILGCQILSVDGQCSIAGVWVL